MPNRTVESRDTEYDSEAVTVHWHGRRSGWTFVYLSLHKRPSDADMKWLKDRPDHWVILVACGCELEAVDAFGALSGHDLNFAVWKTNILHFEKEVIQLSAGIGPNEAIQEIFQRCDVGMEAIEPLEIIDASEAVGQGPKSEAAKHESAEYWNDYPNDKRLVETWFRIKGYAMKTRDDYLRCVRYFCYFARGEKEISLRDIKKMGREEMLELVHQYVRENWIGHEEHVKLLRILKGVRGA